MRLSILALASFPVLAPAQNAAPREVTEERIAAAFADAHAAVKEVLAIDVDAKVAPRIVAAKDVAERVAEENLPVVRLRQPDAGLAASEAAAIGQTFAQSTLAKYTWTTKELLVSAKTWRRQSAMTNRPALTSDEALRAVLVHELVHAIDDARHDFGKTLATLRNVDACQGFNGVLEGHAQLLARRVCEKRGWKAGFDAFTANIGGLPEGAEAMDPVQVDMLRAQNAIASAPYFAGESFMAAVDARGAESVARAFREPPENMDLLYRPEWYLEPAKRPAAKYALDAALELFSEPYAAETWASTRMTAPRAQLEAAMHRAGPERVKAALDGRLTTLSIGLQPRADPNSKLVSAALSEFVDEASARKFIETGDELGKLRDAGMRAEGRTVKLLEFASTPLDPPAKEGAIERRTLDNAGFEFVVTQMRCVRGPLVLELVFSNEPIEDAALRTLVKSLFDAARPAATKSK